jgi:hypothetical protein
MSMKRLNSSGSSGLGFGLRGMTAAYAQADQSSNGNRNWRGYSGAARGRCRLSEGGRRWAPRERSCFIGEPFTLGTNDRAIGAFQIIDAKRDAMIVPEIEFGRVAMQVRFADVEIAAVNPAFEDRKEILDRVGMPERGADIFLGRVIDRSVARELATDRPIDRSIVGHQIGSLVDVRDDDRLQSLCGHIRHVKAADPAIAFDQRQHWSLWRDLTFAIRGFAADEGFVCLDNQIFAAKLVVVPEGISVFDLQDGHCLTDAMPEEPCRFETTPEGTVKLAGGDTFLAAAHHIDRLKPDIQRDMARFENGPHPHRERFAASAALQKAGARALTFQPGRLADRTAMGADRAVWPNPAFDVGDSGGFVAELGGVEGGLHGGCSPEPPFYL